MTACSTNVRASAPGSSAGAGSPSASQTMAGPSCQACAPAAAPLPAPAPPPALAGAERTWQHRTLLLACLAEHALPCTVHSVAPEDSRESSLQSRWHASCRLLWRCAVRPALPRGTRLQSHDCSPDPSHQRKTAAGAGQRTGSARTRRRGAAWRARSAARSAQARPAAWPPSPAGRASGRPSARSATRRTRAAGGPAQPPNTPRSPPPTAPAQGARLSAAAAARTPTSYPAHSHCLFFSAPVKTAQRAHAHLTWYTIVHDFLFKFYSRPY
jgi:hypothetical protein